MGTGGNFGHDTTISAVLIELRQNDVGHDLATTVRMPDYNGSSGFVTTCLNA
ncbi:hypothetical protein D3C80_2076250 [compost metagenome]